MYAVAFKLLVLSFIALVGCGGPQPLRVSEMTEPELRTIHTRFVQRVHEAYSDPDITWNSGWLGNTLANTFSESHRGLCYQWQEWIYLGVHDTVEEVGWESTGVIHNMDTGSEHHAVIVFDPMVTRADALLQTPHPPAYVLDAWKNGEAETYLLSDWLQLNYFYEGPTQLEDLTWLLRDREISTPSDR